MTRIDTCDACGRTNVLCEVEIYADSGGLIVSPICTVDNFLACTLAQEPL